MVDVSRVRRLVECQALGQAVARHPAGAGLRAAVDAGTACMEMADWQGVGTANMAFHRSIVELADSERLNTFFAQVLVELRLVFGLLENAEFLHAPYVPMNRRLLELFEAARFGEAAAALADYLLQSERVVLAVYAARLPSR